MMTDENCLNDMNKQQKRKYCQDSEDELFFAFENEKKKRNSSDDDSEINLQLNESEDEDKDNEKDKDKKEEKDNDNGNDNGNNQNSNNDNDENSNKEKKTNTKLELDSIDDESKSSAKITEIKSQESQSPVNTTQSDSDKINKLKSITNTPKQQTGTSLLNSSPAASSPTSTTTAAAAAAAMVKTPLSDRKLVIQTKLQFKSSPSVKPSAPTASTAPTVTTNVSKPTTNGELKIEDYLHDETWKKLLKEEFEKKYFTEINKFLSDGYKKNIFRPPKELVFNALNSTKLNQIKVVIIGQDPYHDDGQAHGLAFSVPKGIALPPSLRNIFIELKNDLPDFERDEKLGGCLQKWTQQGVFLLNTFLTVEAHKAGSHAKIGWENFTDKIIKIVSEKNSGCVFLLWGNFAQRKESLIDKKRHKVIKCAHPSPFSCQRFFGSKCFSQANSYLKSIGKTPVNWSLKE